MKFNSIKFRMALITIIAIVFIEIIATIYSYSSQRNDMYESLDMDVKVIEDNFAQNISIPLYDLNDEAIDNVIKITLAFRPVEAIAVTENDETKVVRSVTIEEDEENGEPKVVKFKPNDTEKEFYKIIKKKIMHNGNSIGNMQLFITDKEVTKSLSSTFWSLILVNLMIVLGILVTLLVTLQKIVSQPIEQVANMLTDISEGEGDLTARLKIKQDNEIGVLSKAFNTFVEKIQLLIKDVIVTTKEVNNVAHTVKGLSDETTNDLNKQFSEVNKTNDLIEEITASADNIHRLTEGQSTSVMSTEKAVNTLAEQTEIMRENAEKMRNFIDSTSEMIKNSIESIGEISGSIKNNNQGLQKVIDNLTGLNDGISQVSAAIEQTTVSINEISENLNNTSTLTNETANVSNSGKNIINNTIEAMNDIDVKVNNIGGVIDRLKNSSNEIGEVVKVIEDIAEQTNLLALNAAIEAARAGEAGKGFAVVADEIRKLAEKTTKSTNMIDETVKTIQNDTDLAVKSMDEGKKDVSKGVELVGQAGHALEEIYDKISNVNNLIKSISISSTEQNQAAATISKLVVDMNNSSVESLNEARRQAEVSGQLVEMAEEVAAGAMSIDTKAMSDSADTVTNLVIKNSESVQEIKIAIEEIEAQSMEIKEDAKKQSDKTTLIKEAVESITNSNSASLQKANQLSVSSDSLQNSSTDLSNKVSTFKI